MGQQENPKGHIQATLRPSGQVVEISSDRPLLEGLSARGIYIKSSCGGQGNCSDCLVKILSGQVSPPTNEEIKLLGTVFHITRERLSCQLKALGPVEVDLSGQDKALHQRQLRQKTGKLKKKS